MPWFLVSTPEYERVRQTHWEPAEWGRDCVEVEAVDEESARFLGVIALHEEESGWLRECEGRIHAEDLQVASLGEGCIACGCPHASHEPDEGNFGKCLACDECPAFEAPTTAVAAA